MTPSITYLLNVLIYKAQLLDMPRKVICHKKHLQAVSPGSVINSRSFDVYITAPACILLPAPTTPSHGQYIGDPGSNQYQFIGPHHMLYTICMQMR